MSRKTRIDKRVWLDKFKKAKEGMDFISLIDFLKLKGVMHCEKIAGQLLSNKQNIVVEYR